ncbi:hypothetical protein [Kingella sp. (in: b-proteobacteria)]|nr:hypothetical protein [Kingella sp. (in: b-proteobacteria)]
MNCPPYHLAFSGCLCIRAIGSLKRKTKQQQRIISLSRPTPPASTAPHPR